MKLFDDPADQDRSRTTPWHVRALRAAVALFMFAIMGVMFADVVGRYVFNSAIQGGFEIIAYLLGMLIFCGFALVTRSEGHITVGLLDGVFHGRAKWIRDLFVLVDAGDGVNWISGIRLDLPELGNFANTVLIARGGYCGKNPTICRKVVKGYQGALQIIHHDPARALKILQRQFKKMKPKLVKSAFENMVRVATSKADGRFPKGGLAGVQDFMVKAGHMKEKDKFTSFGHMYTERYLTDAPSN